MGAFLATFELEEIEVESTFLNEPLFEPSEIRFSPSMKVQLLVKDAGRVAAAAGGITV